MPLHGMMTYEEARSVHAGQTVYPSAFLLHVRQRYPEYINILTNHGARVTRIFEEKQRSIRIGDRDINMCFFALEPQEERTYDLLRFEDAIPGTEIDLSDYHNELKTPEVNISTEEPIHVAGEGFRHSEIRIRTKDGSYGVSYYLARFKLKVSTRITVSQHRI